MVPAQSFATAAADGAGDGVGVDNGDDKTTKDFEDSIDKDVNAESGSRIQHLDQDDLCYKGDDCVQANEGQQTEGKDNDASGFNDQSRNIQQQPAGLSSPTPPLQTGTLFVTKNVTCPDGFSCPPPSDFTMRVTGTPGNGNPRPSSFAGSEGGTTVTLNFGDYNVTEDFEDNASSPLKVVRNFSADCRGSIESAGQGRECNVTNEFVVKKYLFLDKFGTEGPGDGQFELPSGVAVNPTNGNVYVADRFNDRIQVFDSSGAFITKFGTEGPGDGQFNEPFGVAVNPTTGNVYVADLVNNRIQVFFLDP